MKKLLENMREFFKAVRKFDSFIKMQLLIEFVVSLGWALILPIVAKLQGLMWTLSAIAIYGIIKQLSNFLLPLLDNITLKEAYKLIIIMDILYLVCIPLYFVDPVIFLIAEATVIVIYSVIMNKFNTIYNRFVAHKYSESVYNHIQNAEKMTNSAASIIGYLVVVSVEFISSDIEVAMYTFMVILLISIAFELYNYLTYWTEEKLKILQVGS